MSEITQIILAVGGVGIVGYLAIAIVSAISKGKIKGVPVHLKVAGQELDIGQKMAEPCDDELDKELVDEEAVSHPSLINPVILNRQLSLVWSTLKDCTAKVSDGIQDSNREAHVHKRAQVQIVFDSQERTIIERLIYNGLHRLKELDIDDYCQSKAVSIWDTIERDLRDKFLFMGIGHQDIIETLFSRREVCIAKLRTMYHECVRYAKEGHCGGEK